MLRKTPRFYRGAFSFMQKFLVLHAADRKTAVLEYGAATEAKCFGITPDADVFFSAEFGVVFVSSPEVCGSV